MTDQELRQVIRDVVARHFSAPAPAPGPAAGPSVTLLPPGPLVLSRDASHGLLSLAPGSATDGLCVIEPAVMCAHCGFCRSYGH